MRDGSVACIKVRYKTEPVALDEMKRIQRALGGAHKPVRTYMCPWCNGYHLTSRRA